MLPSHRRMATGGHSHPAASGNSSTARRRTAAGRPSGSASLAVLAKRIRVRGPPDTIARMPDSGDELETRVARLEDEVIRLKEGLAVSRADAAAARVLAGGADRDMSEIRDEMRAHRQSLNALRETQVDFSRQLTTTDSKIETLRSEMQQGFGMLNTGMAQIFAILTNRQREDDQPW
jgi:chromosome segregation ATPase